MNELSTLQILQGARELLSEEKNWRKGAYAGKKRPDGSIDLQYEGLLNWSDQTANCWCSLGACLKVSGAVSAWTSTDSAEEVLIRALREITGDEEDGVACFNDNPSTEHEDVLRMFDLAIEIVKESEKVETLIVKPREEPQTWVGKYHELIFLQGGNKELLKCQLDVLQQEIVGGICAIGNASDDAIMALYLISSLRNEILHD